MSDLRPNVLCLDLTLGSLEVEALKSCNMPSNVMLVYVETWVPVGDLHWTFKLDTRPSVALTFRCTGCYDDN